MKMAHRGEEGGADGGGRIWGVGRPLLGYRNWDGYSAARDGPDTRFRERRGVTAERALAEELQRRRPELMVDADTVEGVLREDRCVRAWIVDGGWEGGWTQSRVCGGCLFNRMTSTRPLMHHTTDTSRADRRARRLEGMRLQGNALWVPPLPPHPHHHDGSTRGRGRKRLLVHCAGPVLDRLHLSWVHEQQQASSCWMSGGRWCSGEVGSIRQLAPMNQYDRNDHACVLAEPPTCFARGDTEAALFQLLEAAEEEEAEEEVMEEEEGEGRVPYYVSPLQKLLVRASCHVWLTMHETHTRRGETAAAAARFCPVNSALIHSHILVRPALNSSPLQNTDQQFPHRLLDVATRPAKSVHRAAFLSDDLGVHEWLVPPAHTPSGTTTFPLPSPPLTPLFHPSYPQQVQRPRGRARRRHASHPRRRCMG